MASSDDAEPGVLTPTAIALAAWWGGYGTYWHFFVQDDLKLSDRLTVNIGLRYEYTPFLNGYKGQVATFDPSRAQPIIVASETDQINLTAQPAAAVGYNLYKNLIQTSHQAGLPYSIAYPDTHQFAPRVGFAWRPFGQNTVIRGGYGIFYSHAKRRDYVARPPRQRHSRRNTK